MIRALRSLALFGAGSGATYAFLTNDRIKNSFIAYNAFPFRDSSKDTASTASNTAAMAPSATANVYDSATMKTPKAVQDQDINHATDLTFSNIEYGMWYPNWDRRDPAYLAAVRAAGGKHGFLLKERNLSIENVSETEIARYAPRATRNLILIRHGQYLSNELTDERRELTDLGRLQADSTGERLRELGLPWKNITTSTMTRARQTTKLITQRLPDVTILETDMLREGAPIPPDPQVSSWAPPAHQFFQDSVRIEAAFRNLVHRADVEQKEDSYEIIICHANVIRYFLCRALQLPPEAWLRFSLPHCSITALTIRPSGRVSCRSMGDSGHMPVPHVTTS